MNIKKALKVTMMDRGIDALQLSKMTGLSRDGIYKSVNGSKKLDNLALLCSALEIKVSELIALAERYSAED